MPWYDQTYPLNINPFKNAAVGVSDYIGQFKGNDPTTWLGGASGQAVDALQQHKIDTKKAIGDQSKGVIDTSNPQVKTAGFSWPFGGTNEYSTRRPSGIDTLRNYQDQIRSAPGGNYQNWQDLIVDDTRGANLIESDIDRVQGIHDQLGTYDDTSGRQMKLKGQPFFGNYQKFPPGDQWRNKDKYLRSQDYLSTLEPSEAGAGYDKRGFNFSGIPSALANMLNYRNPLSETSSNFNPRLAGQIEGLRNIEYKDQFGKDQTGSWLGTQSSPYQITGGPLAGKNLVSGFGTNDYDEMLAKKREWFEKRGKGRRSENKYKALLDEMRSEEHTSELQSQ